MSPGALNQQFIAADGWQAGGRPGTSSRSRSSPINVDPAARGHVLRYVATLVSANGDVVSFIESNQFILV